MPPAVPNVPLSNGVSMPQLGFGVWQVPNEQAPQVVATALEAGYRSIDTAALYGNEAGVGAAVAQSGLSRDEVFVTSKVWNSAQGYDSTLRAFDATMAELDLDVLDLYLVHWPAPKQDRYVETWKALEQLNADGRVRAIGVSNFSVAHLDRLAAETSTVPMVNQIELHPRLPQPELRDYHAEHGIVTVAWSPLGQGQVLADRVLRGIAQAHDRTPAQVVLRWHLQQDVVAIPKSVTPSRIRENLDVFDFTLSDDDLAALAGLATGERIGPDPDRFG